MISNYVEIIRHLEDEIFSYNDEFEDENIIFGGDSAKFKLKTDHNLVFDEKINIPVCVISLSSVIKKKWILCSTLNYKNVCMKVFFKKCKPFLCINIKDG